MIDRRTAMMGVAATMATPLWAQKRADPFAAIRATLGAGGRLGLAVHDTGTGRRLSIDAEERYALCSTFKVPLAAAILSRVDQKRLELDRAVRFSGADLLDYAPVVKAALPQGQLSIEKLCEGAVVMSDNAAANLLLPQIGGPKGLTAWLREQKDGFTRLDRDEPTLNDVRGDEVRDTTTPLAMVGLLQRLFTGGALSAASRDRLIGWMVASSTGRTRLRAGLPQNWRVGDKTGTSGEGWVNDIAVAWVPGRAKPIVIACYIDAPNVPTATAEAAHAQVGRLVGSLFG